MNCSRKFGYTIDREVVCNYVVIHWWHKRSWEWLKTDLKYDTNSTAGLPADRPQSGEIRERFVGRRFLTQRATSAISGPRKFNGVGNTEWAHVPIAGGEFPSNKWSENGVYDLCSRGKWNVQQGTVSEPRLFGFKRGEIWEFWFVDGNNSAE